jgi:hypothetical protein
MLNFPLSKDLVLIITHLQTLLFKPHINWATVFPVIRNVNKPVSTTLILALCPNIA